MEGILEAVRRARAEPWTTARVRVDLPREIETESKTAAYISNQFAFARADLRFKKGTKFVVVAEVPFGIAFDEKLQAFSGQVRLVPAGRYLQLDDGVWRHWKATSNAISLPGCQHEDSTNTVLFTSRPLTKDLTSEMAFGDLKGVLEFLLAADPVLAEAVGVDLGPGEEVT